MFQFASLIVDLVPFEAEDIGEESF